MTRLNKNNKTLNSLRSRGSRACGLAAVLMVAGALLTSPARAQDPEVGNTDRYRADKTVNDYMNKEQQRVASDFDYAGNSLRVEVWVDMPEGDIYRKGQDLGVTFQANQDLYAVVYRIDTEGLVTVLWPRSRFDDGFVFGGHEYQLPVSGARKLQVSTSEGEGIVEVVASQYPFDLRALELDFHHEHTADRYEFRVAGDPFLAMNEVNYAVTGLEDSGEYVVTNYASYYVHQAVDHPRYLCNQCHIEDEVAYDPYRDECTLTIERDYSWYNGWYDSYGYYPVYGNPVYVYIDPWTWNPWVNYWYTPSYACAPWYGWGWGWGACYSWGYSPYYYGNSMTAYNSGYTRYRPLNRNGTGSTGGGTTKTREYSRGSQMVGNSSVSERDRGSMVSRTRGDDKRRDRTTTVGRGGGQDVAYRGADSKTRSRSSFDQVATRSQGGLRIRESGRTSGSSRTRTSTDASRLRHTAGGEGRRAELVPVTRGARDADSYRGTTRVGGSANGSTRNSGNTPTTVGNSRTSSSGTANSRSSVGNSRSRTSSSRNSVQPRKPSTRLWNSGGSRSSGTNEGSSSRSRSGSVDNRSRSGSSTSNRSRETVSPRKGSSSSKSSGSRSGAVKSNSGSRGGSSAKSGGSRSSGGSSSRSNSGGGSRSSGSRSGSSRR